MKTKQRAKRMLLEEEEEEKLTRSRSHALQAPDLAVESDMEYRAVSSNYQRRKKRSQSAGRSLNSDQARSLSSVVLQLIKLPILF